jgi:long-chain fatty acid transport protein
MKFGIKFLATAVASAVALPVWATNGMNLEGYGSKATAMGGAGMAYDTGNSAVMNNPATLSMMKSGTARFGLGIRNLRPDVTSTGMSNTHSDGTSYLMPSISYMRKSGDVTYGVAVLAQGGMGTDYSSTSELAMGSGDDVRSELGVGRMMFPLSIQMNDRLAVGGSVDVVWAMMDLKMAVPTSNLASMVSGFDAGWGPVLGGLGGLQWGRFDFSNGNDFTGKARGYGLAGKLGATYKLSDALTFGVAYHSETNLSDLETSSSGASLTAGNMGGGALAGFDGKISVRDFQWPSTLGIGLAFQANDRLMLAADVKRINWSDVMKSFKMTFSEASLGDLDVEMQQDWDDQTVFNFGVQYQYTPNLALRAGLNLSDNPVPNSNLNYLFPAIIEDHVTAGFGYKINEDNRIGFSVSYAPEVKETSGAGITTKHSQLNWSLNYVYTFN